MTSTRDATKELEKRKKEKKKVECVVAQFSVVCFKLTFKCFFYKLLGATRRKAMPFRNHFTPFCHVTPFFNYANVRAVVCIINLNV